MFELPEAKRVRRDEIKSPSSSTRSSPEIALANDQEAHARLGQLLAFDISTPDDTDQAREIQKTEEDIEHKAIKAEKEEEKENAQNEDDEQEFEFRLFNVPKKKTTDDATNSQIVDNINKRETSTDEIKTQKLKIRLRSPTPADVAHGDGRFVVPFRGWKYYFTKPELMHISARDDQEQAQIEAEELDRRRQYEDIAVTGAEVLHWAETSETPGCHLPWRVLNLHPTRHRVPKSLLRGGAGPNPNMQTIVYSTEKNKKRQTKPGKKRRIILRTRAAASAAAKAATMAAASSDMTEAEKRNKKNREKKIRKRQRERERKAALAGSTDPDATASVNEDDSN